MKREIIKKGTDEWWIWVVMLKVADRDRKKLNLAPDSAVEIDVEKCNQYIAELNRNPLKRIWLLLTIGDLHPVDRDKIGSEVIVKDRTGQKIDYEHSQDI